MSFIKKLKLGPIVPIRYSRAYYVAEAIALLLLLFSFLTLYLNWSSLSETIPIKFNFAGELVRMGNKKELLNFQFAIALIYLLLTVVSRFPRWYRYPWKITAENVAKQYSIHRSFLLWLKVYCMVGMSFTTLRTIRVALGRAEGMGTFYMPISLVILFAMIAVLFVKAIRGNILTSLIEKQMKNRKTGKNRGQSIYQGSF